MKIKNPEGEWEQENTLFLNQAIKVVELLHFIFYSLHNKK